MLFFVFGLPGKFSRWCEAVVAELARRDGDTAEVIRADTLHQIANRAIRVGASQAVVSSRQPGGRLRTAIIGSRRRFIVALDDPRQVLLDLVHDREVDLAAAVQQLASGCAALGGFAEAPGALILHGAHDWPRMADTVAAIAQHLYIDIDAAEIAELVHHIAGREPAHIEYDAGAWWSGLDTGARELVIGALMPFVGDWANGGELSLAWTYDLFFVGDRPEERASGPIDITGRARCLLNGPHVMLPTGSWSLSLTALFSREAAEHEFIASVHAGGSLASGVVRPRPDGSAEVRLDFTLDDTIDLPVSIRVYSQRAAFDGSVVEVKATVVRAAAATSIGTGTETALIEF